MYPTPTAAPSSSGPDILNPLLALVDKSLIVADEKPMPDAIDARSAWAPWSGGVRYHLLETTREYALAKLEEYGEKPVVHTAHAMYFAKWVGGPAAQVIEAPGQRRNALSLDALAKEIDNLRHALGHFLEQADAEPGLGIAVIRHSSSGSPARLMRWTR